MSALSRLALRQLEERRDFVFGEWPSGAVPHCQHMDFKHVLYNAEHDAVDAGMLAMQQLPERNAQLGGFGR